MTFYSHESSFSSRAAAKGDFILSWKVGEFIQFPSEGVYQTLDLRVFLHRLLIYGLRQI